MSLNESKLPALASVESTKCPMATTQLFLYDLHKRIPAKRRSARTFRHCGQRRLKPETLPSLLHSCLSIFTFQRSQFFSSTQIPVCLGFLAKNKDDNSVVVNEPAHAIVNLALRGIDLSQEIAAAKALFEKRDAP